MPRPRLVDRRAELRTLREEADVEDARLVLVHGRRRVGKTFLLERAWEDRRTLYYLAVNTTPEQNRRDLLRELRGQLDRDLDPDDYPNWRTTLRLLGQIAGDRPLIVVLDEFQYLLAEGEDSTDVVSQLNAAWESDLADRDITLVLCGSEVGTMRGLARRGALFGRMSREIHLEPFDYREAAGMLPGRPHREQAYLYGIFGGTPAYLATVREGRALGEVVPDVFLEPGGEVHLQVGNLVEQEEGIRRPGHYRAVLAAIAAGRTRTNEIAQAAGFGPDESGKTRARHVIGTLMDLGYVRRERNFDAGRTTPWRHHLADNALEFWFRYVHPNRSLLATGEAEAVWRDRIRPDLDDHMGWSVFEGMVEAFFRARHAALELPPPARWSRWIGKDRNRRDIEIDVVCRLADDRLLTGEVKWSSSPVGSELHAALTRDLRDLADSGRGWARRALEPGSSAGRLYVSAAGFTEEFRSVAEEDPEVRLVDLEDLYA